MPLLVGDPKLIEHRGVGDLAQAPIELVGREASLLRGIDEMGDDARLRHHMGAEHLFHLAWNFVGEACAAGKEIGHHFAGVLGRGEQRVARVPCEQRRDDNDRAGEQPGHEQHQPCSVTHDQAP